VDQVVSTNGRQISISTNDNYLSIGTGKFHSGSKGDGPTMRSVKSISVEEGTGNPSGTAYARDKDKIIDIKLELIYSPEDRLSNDSVATTTAGGGGDCPGPHIFCQGMM
jgi:hypothetical protein